ncbi:MAG: hypothetical protein R2710_01130 [Acidimicrobiales bacterium]
MLALVLAGLLAGCGGSEGADQEGATAGVSIEEGTDPSTSGDGSAVDEQADGSGENAGSDSLEDAPLLEPVQRFAVDKGDAVDIGGIALSPDGVTVVVALLDDRGSPTSLQFYDAATGTQSQTVEVDAIGMGPLYWSADGRLTSLLLQDGFSWQSWEPTTFAPMAPVPADPGCADGQLDKATGAVFSTDDLGTMGDTICRVDTLSGEMAVVPDGTLVTPDEFWVRPGSDELVIVHYPDPDAKELLVLDSATFEPRSRTELTFDQWVKAVGATTWIQDVAASTHVLEPGSIAAPAITAPLRASGAGTMFISADGAENHVVVSATDGSVIGTFPAQMNLSNWSDWSIDDSVFARATLDDHIEIFHF